MLGTLKGGAICLGIQDAPGSEGKTVAVLLLEEMHIGETYELKSYQDFGEGFRSWCTDDK